MALGPPPCLTMWRNPRVFGFAGASFAATPDPEESALIVGVILYLRLRVRILQIRVNKLPGGFTTRSARHAHKHGIQQKFFNKPSGCFIRCWDTNDSVAQQLHAMSVGQADAWLVGDSRNPIAHMGPCLLYVIQDCIDDWNRAFLKFRIHSFSLSLTAFARAAAVLAFVAGAIRHHQHAALAARWRAFVGVAQS